MKKLIMVLMVVLVIGFMGCDNSTGGGGKENNLEYITFNLFIKNNTTHDIDSIRCMAPAWFLIDYPDIIEPDTEEVKINSKEIVSLQLDYTPNSGSIEYRVIDIYGGIVRYKEFTIYKDKPNIRIVITGGLNYENTVTDVTVEYF